MPGKFGVPEILLLGLLFVLIFGSKKLPDAARSIGRSMRIFRSEVKGMSNDQSNDENGPKQTQS